MEVIRWQPPWPLIQTSSHEWVVMRDSPSRPVALVRLLPDKPEAKYRVVRWAPLPEDRRLFEYFPTLEAADMSVTFMEKEPSTGRVALTTARSPEWARFERWFWSQASERLLLEMTPQWLFRERLALKKTVNV